MLVRGKSTHSHWKETKKGRVETIVIGLLPNLCAHTQTYVHIHTDVHTTQYVWTILFSLHPHHHTGGVRPIGLQQKVNGAWFSSCTNTCEHIDDCAADDSKTIRRKIQQHNALCESRAVFFECTKLMKYLLHTGDDQLTCSLHPCYFLNEVYDDYGDDNDKDSRGKVTCLWSIRISKVRSVQRETSYKIIRKNHQTEIILFCYPSELPREKRTHFFHLKDSIPRTKNHIQHLKITRIKTNCGIFDDFFFRFKFRSKWLAKWSNSVLKWSNTPNIYKCWIIWWLLH